MLTPIFAFLKFPDEEKDEGVKSNDVMKMQLVVQSAQDPNNKICIPISVSLLKLSHHFCLIMQGGGDLNTAQILYYNVLKHI